MLIQSYEVLQVPGGCEDCGETVSIQANLSDDISAVYPYVNALLLGAQYNHSGRVLRWREDSHVIVLRRRELAVSNLSSWSAAEAAIERLIEYLNGVWERRDQLDSDESTHVQATPMAVYKLLPNTNCRECGAQTCYAFALRLIAREASVDACSPILEPEFAPHRAELQHFFAPPPVVLFG